MVGTMEDIANPIKPVGFFQGIGKDHKGIVEGAMAWPARIVAFV